MIAVIAVLVLAALLVNAATMLTRPAQHDKA